jgi:lipid A 3-O-deacylase
MKRVLLAAAALLSLAWAGPSSAGEVFVGVYAHNITFIGDNIGIGAVKREDGEDIHFGYRTDRINYLWFLGKPQAYAFASINDRGASNFAAAGLAWPITLFHSPFYVRPGIGLAYTDGETSLPPPAAPGLTPAQVQQRLVFNAHHLDFGDPVQFEPELALGYHLSEHWSAELSYTHISNGQIFHHGENEGLDDAGGRLIYKF